MVEITIREAKNKDSASIRSVISLAFDKQPTIRNREIIESLLFKELIQDGHDIVSLVAEESETIIGHVLVSPVSLEPNNGLICGQVAPLSVHPDFQSQGVGKSLMYAVIEKSKEIGLDTLFLLGDPNYYKLFGFLPSKVKSNYGPSEHFQQLVLKKNSVELTDVFVRLAPAFSRLGL